MLRSLLIPSSFVTIPSYACRSSPVLSAQLPSSRPSHERPRYVLVPLLLRATNQTMTVSRLRPSMHLRPSVLPQGLHVLTLFFPEMSTIDQSSRSRSRKYDRLDLPSRCPSSMLTVPALNPFPPTTGWTKSSFFRPSMPNYFGYKPTFNGGPSTQPFLAMAPVLLVHRHQARPPAVLSFRTLPSWPLQEQLPRVPWVPSVAIGPCLDR